MPVGLAGWIGQIGGLVNLSAGWRVSYGFELGTPPPPDFGQSMLLSATDPRRLWLRSDGRDVPSCGVDRSADFWPIQVLLAEGVRYPLNGYDGISSSTEGVEHAPR